MYSIGPTRSVLVILAAVSYPKIFNVILKNKAGNSACCLQGVRNSPSRHVKTLAYWSYRDLHGRKGFFAPDERRHNA